MFLQTKKRFKTKVAFHYCSTATLALGMGIAYAALNCGLPSAEISLSLIIPAFNSTHMTLMPFFNAWFHFIEFFQD